MNDVEIKLAILELLCESDLVFSPESLKKEAEMLYNWVMGK